MYNDINLLPDKILYRKQRFLKKALVGIGIICLCVAIVFLLSLKTLQRMRLEDKLNNLESRIDTKAISLLNEKNAELDKKKEESKEAIIQMASIPVEKIKASELIKRITNHLPSTIYIEIIKVDTILGEVKCNLKAEDRADITTLLERLHDDKLFSDINMSEISGQPKNIKFELTITLA